MTFMRWMINVLYKYKDDEEDDDDEMKCITFSTEWIDI